jgi:zinc and cadmium transporter
MSPELLLLTYCVLILFVSVGGGLIPLVVRLTHQRMQLAISLVAGVMLGVGLLHMLPHALEEAPDQVHVIFACVLVGFLTMFFIERFLCFHHHDVPSVGGEKGSGAHSHESKPHRHDHALAGGSDDAVDIRHEKHRLNWVGASIGLTLHTIIAGIALAASFEAQSRGDNVAALAGFGTFLVIFLHKPFDAMTITTLMTVGGWKKSITHLVNGVFALMIPVGVGLFYLGLSHAGDEAHLIAYALAFSAGTFLCVSMSDLLPELQFHAHDRLALSFSVLLGLSVAGVAGLFEEHDHDHAGHGHSLATAEDHDEHGHADHGVGDPASHEHETAEADRDHDEEGHGHAEEGHDPEHAPSATPENHATDEHRTPEEGTIVAAGHGERSGGR